MRKFWVAATMLFLAVFMVVTQVWALEITVGGEFRFRARQRSDFDLQAFNKNQGHSTLVPNTGSNPWWNDAPISAVTYYNEAWWDNGLTSPLRSASARDIHRFERARTHGDVGNTDGDYIYDRIRIYVDAKIVEGLRAYAMFENYSDWGLSNGGYPGSLNLPLFKGGDGSSGIYGDRAGVNIRYAWVDFVVPKTPVHVKIGRQPFNLGHGILFNSYNFGSDMAYVYAPIGPVTMGAFYGKFLEVNRANSDDASFAGAHLDFAINPANKLSAFYRYAWQKTTRYIGLGSAATGTFGGPLALGSALNSLDKYEANQHGIGFTADGKVSLGKVGLFYAAEIDYLWGQYTDWKEPRSHKPYGQWNTATTAAPNARFQEDLYQSAWGYGVQLGVDLKWIKFDVAHSYGSGDKTRATDNFVIVNDGSPGGRRLHQWTTGRRVEGFDAWGGDNMYSPWYTDIFMGSGKSASFGGSGLGTTGFTRKWGYTGDFGDVIMIKPTLQVLPFDNLSADVSYAAFWKTSNTNSNGAGVGSTVDGESGSIVLWKSNANNREQPNKQKINPFLGQEINAHLVYYPYKNLMLKGWAAIFFPGDWFKVQQRSHNYNNPVKGHDTVGLKPAWALQLDVIVTF